MKGSTQRVLNHLVNFRIIDAFHPTPDQLLRELHGEDLLQGVVVDVADGASREDRFAVVQVDGVRSPVIVSLNRVVEAL